MIGLLALGLTSIMIFTLVKNALFGKQLSKEDQTNAIINLILPLSPSLEVSFEAWQKSITSFRLSSSQLKIHVLIDGAHPSLNSWDQLQKSSSLLTIHHFSMRPTQYSPIPWMLEQITHQIHGQVVIIGDPDLVPTQEALLSTAKNVIENNRSYFVIPQTAKENVMGEAINSLNPTLAFTSFFGFHKWRQNLTHPLLSISEGYMGMSLKDFQEIDFKAMQSSSWKDGISRQWEKCGKNYHLAFGEKLLLRYYQGDFKSLVLRSKNDWGDLWEKKDKSSFWLFLVATFLWSFPFLFLLSHPLQSLASFFLLVLYRFFSKIIFQESWTAIALHPLACGVSLYGLGWYFYEKIIQERRQISPR